jgi:hypothetical protein
MKGPICEVLKSTESDPYEILQEIYYHEPHIETWKEFSDQVKSIKPNQDLELYTKSGQTGVIFRTFRLKKRKST